MRRLGCAFVCWLFLQCSTNAGAGDLTASLVALRHAPNVIEIDGVALQLEAEVWRDFMPTAYPDEATMLKQSASGPGRPMTATLRLRLRNGQQIPPGVNVDVA